MDVEGPEATVGGSEATGEGPKTTVEGSETTVEVRALGHVRDAIGTHHLTFTFEGDTLREFLDGFFEAYDVKELLIARTTQEATARGWADVDDPPGTWRTNPEGERTRAYARVLVNGRFNEHRDGFDTRLEDGDRVALVYPFVFCV